MNRTLKWLLPAMAWALFAAAPAVAADAPEPQSTPAQEAPVALAGHSLTEAPAPASSAAPGTAKPLTLEECIRMALGQHPRIKGAEQDLRAGQYVTREAISAFWPQINFLATRDYEHIEREIRVGGGSFTTTANFVANNLTFNTTWTLFDFGRTYYKVKSLAELEDSLLGTLTGTEQGVAYDAMNAYYNLLKTQKLVKVSQETLGDANVHLNQAHAFYEVGTKPKFDVTQAEVQVDNAKVSLIQAEDAVKAARITLNTKIGIPAQTPTEVEDRPNLEEFEKPLEGYYQDALKNRPEIQTLDATVRSNQMAVKQACSGYLPILSTSASQNWYKEEHTDFLSNEDLQIAVSVPIFTGFLVDAQVGQARANLLSTKYKLEDEKLTVLNDVSQAYLAVEDAKARFTALDTAVKSARENLDIAQGRYEAGVGTIIDVTDAQSSLTTAETNLTTAFYDYHTAFTSLLKSVGKSVK